MPDKQKSFFYFFIIIFLPALFVSFVLLTTVFFTRYTSAKDSLMVSRTRKLELMHTEIEFTLKNIESDLLILSEMDPFKELLNSNSLESLNAVEDIFKLFSTERKVYDQVRFLDKTGMEIIRVNYNDGLPSIVSHENLQNKGNRYYFQDTYLLEKGKVFFSPLDLNIEGGLVEIPEKPMVRVGIPVFDKNGGKKGIILLNYFGQNITDIVSIYTKSSEEKYSLLNSDSYWLYSIDPEKSWSFMYKDRLNQTFGYTNPEIWNDMQFLDSGVLKNSDCTYIFITVSPLHENMNTSTGSSSATGKSSILDTDDYYWKIVADIPDTDLYTLVEKILYKMMILIVIVIVVTVILSVILAKLWYIQKLAGQQTKKSLEEKELLLREIHHRVKNSLALVSSFVGLYQGENSDEKNDSFFDSLQQKINTISLVHTYLYQSSDIENISLKSYIKDLLESMIDKFVISTGHIGLDLELADIFMPAKPTISVGLIISELTINSLKYAFNHKEDGTISIQGSMEDGQLILIYSDNGEGLSESFDIQNSGSLGMILIDSLTKQLNGVLTVKTGKNFSFTIKFPLPS
jgi:two-component sensor histidine kinase